jgi:hypothetical protein
VIILVVAITHEIKRSKYMDTPFKVIHVFTTNMYNQHVQPTCTTPCTILHVHWWVHPAILRCWNQTRSSPVCSEKVNNISISGQTGWSNMVNTVEKYNHTTTHFLFRRHWCTVGGGDLSASAAAFWTSTRKGAAETRVSVGVNNISIGLHFRRKW